MCIIIQLHHSRWSHWFSWNYILLKYPHYPLESILIVYIFSLNVTYCHESSIIPLYWTTYLAFDLENILASNYHNLKWKFNQLPKGSWLQLFTFHKGELSWSSLAYHHHHHAKHTWNPPPSLGTTPPLVLLTRPM